MSSHILFSIVLLISATSFARGADSRKDDVQSPSDRCAPGDRYENLANTLVMEQTGCKWVPFEQDRRFLQQCSYGLSSRFDSVTSRLKFYPNPDTKFDRYLAISRGSKTALELARTGNGGSAYCRLWTDDKLNSASRLVHPKVIDTTIDANPKNADRSLKSSKVRIPLASAEGYYLECGNLEDVTFGELTLILQRMGLNPKYTCERMKETQDTAPAATGVL